MSCDPEVHLQHETPDESPQVAFYEHSTGGKRLTAPLHEYNPLWME